MTFACDRRIASDFSFGILIFELIPYAGLFIMTNRFSIFFAIVVFLAAAFPTAAQSGFERPHSQTTSIAARSTAPGFAGQIENMMTTGRDWLFQTLRDVVVGPMLPYLTMLAWIIASFVLGIGFLRRFSDNKGVGPEQLVRWAIRSVAFMLIVGSAPYAIDVLSATGKFLARPIQNFNHGMMMEFDAKMREYVRNNFAVEDPNALLAERLPNGEPGLVGVILDKNSDVRDITAQMNVLGWDMTRLFTLMVIAQNIIKFGGIFLALAGLFIVIALKLAAPVMSAFGFDEKFAGQIFYPFCWGVATFSLAFPIVRELTSYVAYGIGLIALAIYNREPVFTLDPVTAEIITSRNYDPAASALVVTFMFFVACLSYILVPWLSYRVLRGQVFEGVSQISMGWMLSSVGTALESYGIVAGAAINRQAENTQIQGIYNAEQAAAKKTLEAANMSVEARRVASVAGVEGSLVGSLGQIRANQVTQTLLAEANREYSLSATQAATNREIASMTAENDGTQRARTMDGAKETSLRTQSALQEFGMMKYEAIPGGSQVMGTTLPIRKGVEFYDWTNGEHVTQKSTATMNQTTSATNEMQNLVTQNVTDQRVGASESYQSEMNRAINSQADKAIAANQSGAAISSAAVREGAGINLGGIEKSAELERNANRLNFEARTDAAAINQTAATEAAHQRMMSTVVSAFFRDMDRRLEEMKPKY